LKCLNKNIKASKDILLAKLLSIEENGATALGPALLTSVIIAA
jgi:hypothetical protein